MKKYVLLTTLTIGLLGCSSEPVADPGKVVMPSAEATAESNELAPPEGLDIYQQREWYAEHPEAEKARIEKMKQRYNELKKYRESIQTSDEQLGDLL